MVHRTTKSRKFAYEDEYHVDRLIDGRYRVIFATENTITRAFGPTYIEAYKALGRLLGDDMAKRAGAKHASFLASVKPHNYNNIRTNDYTRKSVKTEVYSG